MSVQDRLIFKSKRVVVPQAAKGELLKRIHNPHLGVNGSLNRARECLYWPGMTGDIKNHVTPANLVENMSVVRPKRRS